MITVRFVQGDTILVPTDGMPDKPIIVGIDLVIQNMLAISTVVIQCMAGAVMPALMIVLAAMLFPPNRWHICIYIASFVIVVAAWNVHNVTFWLSLLVCMCAILYCRIFS